MDLNEKDKLDSQVFEALCYKTAIYLRDILMRIENSYVDESTVLMDEKAVYENSEFENDRYIVFPDDKSRHAFMCLDKTERCIYGLDDVINSNNVWIDIKNIITANNLLTRIYGLFKDDSILMEYKSRRGVWVDISDVELSLDDDIPPIYSTDGLFIGDNMSSRYNKSLEIISDDIQWDWIKPFQNILKCLEQLLDIIDVCSVENISNDIFTNIDAIFTNNTTHTICWKKLAETMFGGLSKLSRYRNENVYEALDWLHDVSYINETAIQNMIDAYLQGIVSIKLN